MQIEISKVSHIYGIKTNNEHIALSNVDLTIEKGSYVAFVGKTGSGKSTLIQTLNGLLLPTSGSVKVDDFVITNKRPKNIKSLRKHAGLVFQFPEYQLFEETVLKDVEYGVKNFGGSPEECTLKAKKALAGVGIPESYFNKSPFELSGGERRKVAIAGILAFEPDILLLDEPTAGLDDNSRKQVLDLVDSLHKEGKTVIVVTHDMSLVTKYCDKVVVLNDGKIAFNGTPSELFGNYKEEFSLEIPELYKICLLLNKKGINVDLATIKNVDDLINVIKSRRKKNG